jgi:hypothetical protein
LTRISFRHNLDKALIYPHFKFNVVRIKLIIALGILLASVVSMHGQADSTFYKVKIDRYQSWQRTGTIVIISGAVVEAAGISLLIGSHFLPEGVSDDPYFAAGYVLMVVGLATMVPGFIFHGIGKRKTKEYQIRLNDLRTGFYYTPRHAGFVLTYRF